MSLGVTERTGGYAYRDNASGRKTGQSSAAGFQAYMEDRKAMQSEQTPAKTDTTDYLSMIQQRRQELFEKIIKGETETKYQIGNQAFTEKEWDQLLEEFDAAQEDVKEAIEERLQKQEEKALQEELLARSVSCTYSGTDPEEQKFYEVTYDAGGIRCTGDEGCIWQIKFESREQYDKVNEFLQRLDWLTNMRFAAHENFWQDFMNDQIDLQDFEEFLRGTNNGVPDYSKVVGDSMYIDREKMKYASYMNPLGFFTPLTKEDLLGLM